MIWKGFWTLLPWNSPTKNCQLSLAWSHWSSDRKRIRSHPPTIGAKKKHITLTLVFTQVWSVISVFSDPKPGVFPNEMATIAIPSDEAMNQLVFTRLDGTHSMRKAMNQKPFHPVIFMIFSVSNQVFLLRLFRYSSEDFADWPGSRQIKGAGSGG